MENIKDFTINHLLLIGILLIVGIYLKRFLPPIKEQFQALIVVILGCLLGHYMIDSIAFGFVIAGLVFYKDILVEEGKLFLECIKELKESKNIKGDD